MTRRRRRGGKKKSRGKKYSPVPKWVSAPAASAGSIGPEWFDEQEFSALSLHGMIFELVDNSIQHRMKIHKNMPLHVVILVKQSSTSSQIIESLVIEDNGGGIEFDVIPDAFSPYGMAQRYAADPESLSEHGIGMKTALRGLGETHSIVTRHHSETKFTRIFTEDIRRMPTGKPPKLERSNNFDFITHDETNGTQIRIGNLTETCSELGTKKGKRKDFEKTLKWALGQRYREFLTQPFFNYAQSTTRGKITPVDRGITLIRLDHNMKKMDEILVDPVHPLYYWNPAGKNGRPWFRNLKVESNPKGHWEASVTLGFGPRDSDDWDALSQNPFIQSHPYSKSDRRLGFDVLRKGIVLQPNFWYQGKGPEDPGIAVGRSNTYMHVRGTIHLGKGFRSKKEKTGVHPDRNWKEFVSKLREILNGEAAGVKGKTFDWIGNHIAYQKDPDDEELSEDNYRMGMVNYFNRSKGVALESLNGKKFPSIVSASEHPVQWNTGIPDIIINEDEDRKKWILAEVKSPNQHISGKEIYQLFCYMQDKGVQFGLMIGTPSETSGQLGRSASNAIKNIQRQNVTGEDGKPSRLAVRKYHIGFWDPETNGISDTQDRILDN